MNGANVERSCITLVLVDIYARASNAGDVSERNFFFQAEDGIRVPLVTGVQTCALPICLGRRGTSERYRRVGDVPFHVEGCGDTNADLSRGLDFGSRRVGDGNDLDGRYRSVHQEALVGGGNDTRLAGGDDREIGSAACRERV